MAEFNDTYARIESVLKCLSERGRRTLLLILARNESAMTFQQLRMRLAEALEQPDIASSTVTNYLNDLRACDLVSRNDEALYIITELALQVLLTLEQPSEVLTRFVMQRRMDKIMDMLAEMSEEEKEQVRQVLGDGRSI